MGAREYEAEGGYEEVKLLLAFLFYCYLCLITENIKILHFSKRLTIIYGKFARRASILINEKSCEVLSIVNLILKYVHNLNL